jgi:hypothetical protein
MNATVHYAEVVEGAGLVGLSVCWLRWAFGLLAALGFRYTRFVRDSRWIFLLYRTVLWSGCEF